jgi:hypothetical protein
MPHFFPSPFFPYDLHERDECPKLQIGCGRFITYGIVIPRARRRELN